jgi:hypothetical protein
MLLRPWAAAGFVCSLAALHLVAQSAAPHLERRGDITQLIVDRKPFLALGGETLNNSATSMEYMRPIWPRLVAMHLNTVPTWSTALFATPALTISAWSCSGSAVGRIPGPAMRPIG